jgi:hypothetical protein
VIKKTTPFIVALLVFGCAGLMSARAQERAEAQTTAPAASTQTSAAQQGSSSSSDADLSITAHVTARELRFEVVPEPKVEFTGKPKRTTLWEAERQNLPRPVQPGVTYRDIGIQLKITSVFADIDRIVAEALGEIPPSEDAPPTPEQQQSPQPQQQPRSQPASPAQPSAPSAQPRSERSPL